MSQQSAQRASQGALGSPPVAGQRVLAEPGLDATATPDPHAALRAQMQQVLAAADDIDRLGAQLCEVLCSWPGVLHAALFRLAGGELRLAAQHGEGGLDLASVLQGREQLQQSPLRTAFPGLLAAGGEAALLDLTGKAGDAMFARALRAYGVEMAVGLPIKPQRQGARGGSVSLLFAQQHALTPAQLAVLDELAQLAGIGLRMAELARETESLRQRLALAATVDTLTGVANRRHGEELLEQEVRRARRYGMPLAVIACDIDRFTEVNDNYGHPVGDMVLRSFSELVQALLRSSDVLVRSGGGEFQVIVPHTSALDCLKLAEKLRQAIEQTNIPGCDYVTVSFGIAQLEGQESGDSLAVRASGALARAKRAGRNRVEMALT
jgi:diguanylate cyclase (GGDEF)-like protein